MKESIGQALIIDLILFFFGILLLLFFGSINYSKAYKAKNRVITTIEKYGKWDDETRDAIVAELSKAGYQTRRVTNGSLSDKCLKYGTLAELVYPKSAANKGYGNDDFIGGRGYDYCVFRRKSAVGEYYQVITFMKFEVPVIGNLLEFKVMGETKQLYDNIEVVEP